MLYSPIFDLYFKYQRVVHDILVQWTIIAVAYLVDSYTLYGLGYNIPAIGLPVFVLGYSIAYVVIRAKGKQKLFGGFANNSLQYAVFLAMMVWLFYYIFVRSQKIVR